MFTAALVFPNRPPQPTPRAHKPAIKIISSAFITGDAATAAARRDRAMASLFQGGERLTLSYTLNFFRHT